VEHELDRDSPGRALRALSAVVLHDPM